MKRLATPKVADPASVSSLAAIQAEDFMAETENPAEPPRRRILWALAGAVVLAAGFYFMSSPSTEGTGDGEDFTPGRPTHDVLARDGTVKERREIRKRADGTEVGDGLRVLYWPNGKKKMAMTYVDGRQLGRATFWYEDGAKRAEGEFADGKANGPMTTWHPNGQKASEGVYANGLPNGRLTTWLEDGRKFEEGEMKDGKREGTVLLFGEDGEVTRVRYVGGVPVQEDAPK